jgi:uncharacterized integral membrane protein (TIGR00697 family)
MNLALSVFVALYAVLFVIAPIMSNRIIELAGFITPMGVFFVATAGGLLDVINNNWGLKQARNTILASLIVRFVIYGLMTLAITFVPFVREAQGFEDIVLTSLRLLIATELASVVSQYFIDAPLFDYMKRRFRFFAARYNVTNLISGIIQSTTFMYIGFAGTEKAHLIPGMILGGLVIKYAVQVVITPVMALLAKWTNVHNT